MTNIIHCPQVCEVLRHIMLYALHDQARNLSKTARKVEPVKRIVSFERWSYTPRAHKITPNE